MRDTPAAPSPIVLTIVNNWGSIPIAEAWNVSGLPSRDSAYRDDVAGDFGESVRLDDDYLCHVADTLYPLLTVAPEGRHRRLNQIIGELHPDPFVTPDGALLWRVPGDHYGALASGIALLIEDCRNGHNLRICEADRCVDAYLDSSNAHTRRYCSSSCQERTRQRHHRQRQRQRRSDNPSVRHSP